VDTPVKSIEKGGCLAALFCWRGAAKGGKKKLRSEEAKKQEVSSKKQVARSKKQEVRRQKAEESMGFDEGRGLGIISPVSYRPSALSHELKKRQERRPVSGKRR